MKQLDYVSPETYKIDVYAEGILCTSTGDEDDEPGNGGYLTGNDWGSF